MQYSALSQHFLHSRQPLRFLFPIFQRGPPNSLDCLEPSVGHTGADRQSAWIVFGRFRSDAQLSCAIALSFSPLPNLFHILFACFPRYRAGNLWSPFKDNHHIGNVIIVRVSRGKTAEATITDFFESFFYGSRKLVAKLLNCWHVKNGSHFWVEMLNEKSHEGFHITLAHLKSRCAASKSRGIRFKASRIILVPEIVLEDGTPWWPSTDVILGYFS